MLEELTTSTTDDIAVTMTDSDVTVLIQEDDLVVHVDASISVNGRGIIPGGVYGEFLAKKSEVDFDVEWRTPLIEGLPGDGTAGQILTKLSSTPFDTAWMDIPPGVPAGGVTGQVLSKATGADYDMTWITPLDAVAKAGDTMTGLLTLSGDPLDSLQAVTKQYVDLRAPINSPQFTGIPLAPLPAGDVGGQIATVQYVQSISGAYLPLAGGALTGFLSLHAAPTASAHAATKAYVDLRAPIESPAFTGTPTAPTAPAGTSSSQIANTSFVNQNFLRRDGALAMTGNLNMGSLNIFNLAEPQQAHHAATRAYVDLRAPIASPAFTGNPTAPTQLTTDNSTRLATTAYVKSNLASYLPLSGGTLTNFLILHADPTLALHAVTKQYVDAANALAMPKAGGTFTGLVTLSGDPTLALHAATKQYADTKAPLASPAFTGTPTAPTATPGTNTTQLATTAFVQSAIGGATAFLPLAGGTMTGDLILYSDPTVALGAATKQMVDLKAPLASPGLTGTPTAPTAAPGTNTTQLATTAFVAAAATAAVAAYLPLAGGTLTGALTLSGDPTAALHPATKQYVDLKAPLASPALTGTPTAPTAVAGTNTTQIATTAFVTAASNLAMPKSGGTFTGAVTLAANPTTDMQAANKLYVDDGLSFRAPLASPSFTGTPLAPTAAPGTNNTQIATTAFVQAATAAFLPLAGGSLSGFLSLHANPTSALHAATKQYVDNADALAMPKTGGAFSGAVTVLAPAAAMQPTTKQYVDDALLLKATIASPAFTGVPTAPTADTADNSTQLATTAFVKANITGLYLPLAGGTLTSFLTLHADPTLALHAATKQYVDARDALYLPLTGGALTGALTVTTGNIVAEGGDFRANRIGDNADVEFTGDVDAGRGAYLRMRTGGTLRWRVGKGAIAETGSDAGSEFVINAYNDAGSFLGAALSITRATRLVNFPVGPTAPTASAGTNTTQLATTQFVTTADNLKLSLSGGTLTGNLINSNGYIQINRFGDATDAVFYMNADAGFWSYMHFFTGNATNRWRFGKDNSAESGSDAGSNFVINAYNDAGVMGNVVTFFRGSKIAAFATSPTAPTPTAGDSSTKLATTAFVANAVAGATSGGVPSGGAANQVLTKKTATNYDMEWRDPAGVGTYLALTGGTMTGQLVLNAASQTGANDAATRSYAESLVSGKADIASPAFTGTPTAPTASAGTNTSQLATTAFVTGAVATSAANYLPLAGGTLTGALTLAADPTAVLHPATKQYVDAADALALLKSGGTMTGVLTMGVGAGLSMGGLVISNVADPTQTHHAVNRAYADLKAPLASPVFTGIPLAPTPAEGDISTKIATTEFVSTAIGDYLPLSGGILTGAISMSSNVISSLADPTQAHHAVNRGWMDTALLSKANLASPAFTGIPTAPTAATGTNTTQIATAALVAATAALNMPKTGGTFTGAITLSGAPTLNLHAATKLYVDDGLALKSNLASPAFTGTPTAQTAAAGTATTQLATTEFVTNADNLKANLAGATFTGAVTVLAPTLNQHPATKLYVDNALTSKANLASPELTGVPTAPTASPGTNNTQIATTAFVVASVSGAGSFLPISGGTLTGFLTLHANPTSSLHASTKGYVDTQLALKASITGANFTGPVNVVDSHIMIDRLGDNANGNFYIQVDPGFTATFNFNSTGGLSRWRMGKGAGAEGANANSNFFLSAFADDGSSLGDVFTVARSSRIMAFSVSPTAPTPAPGTNNTQLATTAFVTAAVSGGGSFLPISGGTLTGPLILNADPAVALGAATKQMVDLKAPLASPAFTGNPTATTQAIGNNSTRLATTAFVNDSLVGLSTVYLPLTGGALTNFLTLHADPSNGLHAATKNYVDTKAPLIHNHAIADITGLQTALDGKAASEHTHAIADVTNLQTSLNAKANLASPVFTGVPAAPTQSTSDNSTRLATTEFVQSVVSSASYLPLAGGTVTGPLYLPVANPVAANEAAHKGYVDSRVALYLPLAGGMLTGTVNLNNQILSNVPNPTQSHHAVNRTYADTKLPLAGGVMTGALNMGGFAIIGVSSLTMTGDVAMGGNNINVVGSLNMYSAGAGINMDGTRVANHGAPVAQADLIRGKDVIARKAEGNYNFSEWPNDASGSSAIGWGAGTLTTGGRFGELCLVVNSTTLIEDEFHPVDTEFYHECNIRVKCSAVGVGVKAGVRCYDANKAVIAGGDRWLVGSYTSVGSPVTNIPTTFIEVGGVIWQEGAHLRWNFPTGTRYIKRIITVSGGTATLDHFTFRQLGRGELPSGEMFGMRAGGTLNQYGAANANALELFVLFLADMGGVGIIGSGTFDIGRPIAWNGDNSNKPFTLMGFGEGTILRRSVQTASGDQSFQINYYDNFTLKDFVIDGNNAQWPTGPGGNNQGSPTVPGTSAGTGSGYDYNHTLAIRYGDHITVDGLTFNYGSKGTMLYIVGSDPDTGGKHLEDLIVRNCFFHGKNSASNGLLVAWTNNSYISNCTAYAVRSTVFPPYYYDPDGSGIGYYEFATPGMGLQFKQGNERCTIENVTADLCRIGIALTGVSDEIAYPRITGASIRIGDGGVAGVWLNDVWGGVFTGIVVDGGNKNSDTDPYPLRDQIRGIVLRDTSENSYIQAVLRNFHLGGARPIRALKLEGSASTPGVHDNYIEIPTMSDMGPTQPIELDAECFRNVITIGQVQGKLTLPTSPAFVIDPVPANNNVTKYMRVLT